jgi:hypothetical protein
VDRFGVFGKNQSCCIGKEKRKEATWLTDIIQPNVMKRDITPVMKKTLKPENVREIKESF